MSVIVKGGGGKSSGLYVWAKYNADIGLGESINNIALANDGTSIDIYVKENLYIKEDGTIGVQGEPYSTVSISSVVEDTCIGGMTPTKYCIGVDGNVYSCPLSHIAGSVDNCVANLVKVVKSTFIDFAVSDSETYYPDGVVHIDGYWYDIFDKSGLYVWKKQHYIEGDTETQLDSVSFSAFSSSLNVCDVYHATSYSYDKSTNTYTLTNPSSFEISKFSGKTLTDYIDQYFMFGGSSGSTMYKFTDSSAHKSGTEYITNVIQIQYTTTKNFLGFVVNDDSIAYPDAGTQDGYFYEKVVEEVHSGLDCGLVTLASASDKITIEHNLGVAPTKCGLIDVSTWSDSSNNTWAASNGGIAYYGGITGKDNCTKTNTTVIFSSSGAKYVFKNGHTFLWVVSV